jgi:hypothetical protein
MTVLLAARCTRCMSSISRTFRSPSNAGHCTSLGRAGPGSASRDGMASLPQSLDPPLRSEGWTCGIDG